MRLEVPTLRRVLILVREVVLDTIITMACIIVEDVMGASDREARVLLALLSLGIGFENPEGRKLMRSDNRFITKKK